jgi:RNA polymerase sigma factor (sigma-70 family)
VTENRRRELDLLAEFVTTGREAAFNDLASLLMPEACRMVASMARRQLCDDGAIVDWHLIDDVVQDSLLKLRAKAAKFRITDGAGGFFSWWWKILHGTLIDLQRKEGTRSYYEYDAARQRPDRADGGGQRRAELHEVLELIEKLPEEDRIALRYYHYDGHSEQSFADVFGCSRRKAAKHRDRAHAHFVWVKCRIDPAGFMYFTYDGSPIAQTWTTFNANVRSEVAGREEQSRAEKNGASRNGTSGHRTEKST